MTGLVKVLSKWALMFWGNADPGSSASANESMTSFREVLIFMALRGCGRCRHNVAGLD